MDGQLHAQGSAGKCRIREAQNSDEVSKTLIHNAFAVPEMSHIRFAIMRRAMACFVVSSKQPPKNHE
jgi:hypothetical protein